MLNFSANQDILQYTFNLAYRHQLKRVVKKYYSFGTDIYLLSLYISTALHMIVSFDFLKGSVRILFLLF